ncbi:DNA helicase [Flavimobilis marinus]|uniref:DNA 3'-5' helicase n=1 Tax=Flavimobilis marinus TaxID=285351 RepID=A0A1I2DHF7_9MICO|nr:UrvD/REP family ATP-dependent DNA helicase [Flavimobilis marinus]GHG45270.1 DNA helicase [Flavimobilis marinus]SFE79360.1 Superfamily I DNA or RNA helicase [Flavimobilis marinus]
MLDGRRLDRLDQPGRSHQPDAAPPPEAVRLRGRGAHAEPVLLDPSQRAALRSAREEAATLVVGAPGSGKTTTALHVALDAISPAGGGPGLDPARVLVLGATRRGASQVRDRLSLLAGRTVGQPMVRTVPALAFAVLARRAAALGLPAPTLISGPEQDQLLAELLAGHLESDGPPLRLPEGFPEEALATRAFRDELRDVLMRAAERGIDPVGLDELGRAHGRPEWRLCARLYEEYLDVTQLRLATPDLGPRYDPAAVVHEATEALLAWREEVETPTPSWDLVVVDDYHEATEATARLLRLFQDSGARLVLLGDPDAAVQGFRGAVPALMGSAAAPSSSAAADLGAHVVVLDGVWRHGRPLRQVVQRAAQVVGAAGHVAHRRSAAVEQDGPAGRGSHVEVAVLPGVAAEHAYVAHAIRSWHLDEGVPWHEVAVVARSGGEVAALRRALAAASVPVSVLGSQGALRDEPAAQPLLHAMRAVVDGLDPEAAAALLLSPLGGLDAVALRRLRRAVRTEELAGGGGRSSDALIVEVLEDPAHADQLPGAVRRNVVGLARVLAAGRAAAATAGATAQTVLWALWDTAGLAERWRSAALAGGAAGARADRDLDAVLALFKAAERFVERTPHAGPGAFAEYVSAQELPADSLAAQGGPESAVSVLTPAGAAGGEWEAVVVAGVQEGVWPDLRLRDSLLGAQALVDVAAARGVAGHVDARRAVLHDEVRSFLVAVSRARRRLLVTAVEDIETIPSALVDLVEPPAQDGPDHRRREVPVPLDLRGLVQTTRARLLEAVGAGHDAEAAGLARLLATLEDAGIRAADPRRWYGVAPVSSDRPLWGPDQQLRVSPSKVDAVTRCPLRWALEAAGGSGAEALTQSLGTLIHAVAEDLPAGTRQELQARLAERWPELGLRPGAVELLTRRRAEAMIDRLATHVAASGDVVGVEAEFRVDVGRAVLTGKVDRLVRVGDAVRVEDLKTGAAISNDEARRNAQLGSYQVALAEGAFGDVPSAGAALVYVGGTTKGPTQRHQAPLETADEPRWAHDLVTGAADLMAQASFTARTNPACDFCPVRRSCPVQPEGRHVTQERA